MNIRTQNSRSKTSAFGEVSGRQNFVQFSHLYSSGTSLKEFLGYCKYTTNPDGKKLSRLVRITNWVIGLNFTLWIGRNSRHHLHKLSAKLDLLSLIGHWHHLEFAFMTLHPNALYQGTIPMKKNIQRRGSYSKTKQRKRAESRHHSPLQQRAMDDTVPQEWTASSCRAGISTSLRDITCHVWRENIVLEIPESIYCM